MLHEAVLCQKHHVCLSTSSQEQPFVSQDAQVEFKNKTKAANAKKKEDKPGQENQSDEQAIKGPAASENNIAGAEDQQADTDVDEEHLDPESPAEEKEEDNKEQSEPTPERNTSQSSKAALTRKEKGTAKAKSKASAKSKSKAKAKVTSNAKAEVESKAKADLDGEELGEEAEDTEEEGEEVSLKAKARAKKDVAAKREEDFLKAIAKVKSKPKAKAKSQSSAGSIVVQDEEEAANAKKRKWDFGYDIPKFKTCQVVVYGSRNEVGLKLKDEFVKDDGKKQARLIIWCSKSDFFKACFRLSSLRLKGLRLQSLFLSSSYFKFSTGHF